MASQAGRSHTSPSLPPACRALQLTKEQLNAVTEGGSLRAALTAENSHQMLLVNDPTASAVAQAWMKSLVAKSGKGGGGGGGPRSKL